MNRCENRYAAVDKRSTDGQKEVIDEYTHSFKRNEIRRDRESYLIT